MILYNITFNIEPQIREEWLHYIQEIYVPEVMRSELFFDYKIFRLLNDSSESGLTYALQFFANNLTEAELYIEQFAPAIATNHNAHFRHQQVSFMTVLESVD